MSSVHRQPLWMLLLSLLLCPAMLAAANVNLQWDPTPQAVTGYKVYYGSSSQSYSGSTIIGPQTKHTMTGLADGIWYFAVAAMDASGQESALSNEVSATLRTGNPVTPVPQPPAGPDPQPPTGPVPQPPVGPVPQPPVGPVPQPPDAAIPQIPTFTSGNAGLAAIWAGKNHIPLMGAPQQVQRSVAQAPASPSPIQNSSAADPGKVIGAPTGNTGIAGVWAGEAVPLTGGASAATASSAADAIVALPLPGANGNYVGMAIVNGDRAAATLTFTALDAAGNPIAGMPNPVVRTLGPGEQLTAADRQLFGEGLSHAPAGWIRVESTTSRIGGHYSVFNQDMSINDAGEIQVLPKQSLIIPAIGPGTSVLTIANPNASVASASFALIGVNGVRRSSVTRSIAPYGAVVTGLAELFGETAPAETDYVRVQGSVGLQACVTRQTAAGNGAAVNGLDANEGDTLVYAPQFAFGKGAESTLSIVNLDAGAGTVALRLLGENAQQVGEPRSVAIAPHGKIQISDPAFFGADAKNATPAHGWIEISSPEVRLAGSVVARNPGRKAVSALPIGPERPTSVLLANMSSDARFSNGIVLINPGGAEAHATIELYAADGRRAATTTETIPAGGRRSRSLKECFPAIAKVNWTSGYVMIRTDHPLVVFSPLADAAGSTISVIPAQGTK